MFGGHHRLDGHKFEQTLGDGDGQGSLACCGPWGRKDSDRLSDSTELTQSILIKSVIGIGCLRMSLPEVNCCCF